jgi:adenylate kinase
MAISTAEEEAVMARRLSQQRQSAITTKQDQQLQQHVRSHNAKAFRSAVGDLAPLPAFKRRQTVP